MRIRKNTKLSSMLFATAGYGGERQDTYVCHLNQSPWDVIPVTSSGDGDGSAELTNLLDSSWFIPSPSSPSPHLIHRFDGEDFNGNVSLGDSNGAAERLHSSIENNRSLVSVERLNLIAAVDNYERSPPDVEEPIDLSDSSDKKSKSLEPNSPVKSSGDDEKMAVTMAAPPKRGRPRGTAKKAPASTAESKNPYEFYYYSGFGPRWGRKRGGSGDEKVVMVDNEKNNNENYMSKKSSSSDEEDDKTTAFGGGSSSFDGFEYVEENYDLMDQDSDHWKKNKKEKMMTMTTMKRGRKPVKERSLKSLM